MQLMMQPNRETHAVDDGDDSNDLSTNSGSILDNDTFRKPAFKLDLFTTLEG